MAKITIKQANAILKAAFDLQTVLVRRAVVEKLKRIDLDTADLLDAELNRFNALVPPHFTQPPEVGD